MELLRSGALILSWRIHLEVITLQFMELPLIPKDSEQFVSVGADGTIKLWDINGTLLETFRGHDDAVRGDCI